MRSQGGTRTQRLYSVFSTIKGQDKERSVISHLLKGQDLQVGLSILTGNPWSGYRLEKLGAENCTQSRQKLQQLNNKSIEINSKNLPE
jgi:hypothetical protein